MEERRFTGSAISIGLDALRIGAMEQETALSDYDGRSGRRWAGNDRSGLVRSGDARRLSRCRDWKFGGAAPSGGVGREFGGSGGGNAGGTSARNRRRGAAPREMGSGNGDRAVVADGLSGMCGRRMHSESCLGSSIPVAEQAASDALLTAVALGASRTSGRDRHRKPLHIAALLAAGRAIITCKGHVRTIESNSAACATLR